MRWRTVRTRVLGVTALATAVAIGVAIASMLGGAPAVLVLEPAATTPTGDGLPDVLRLDDEADRQAFRGWFTYLAEAQFFRPDGRRPVEIDDCAALVRFAYREALKEHTADWAAEQQLDGLEAILPIGKYHYPFTPLGSGLFRVRPGPFRPDDAGGGAFAPVAHAFVGQ